MARGQPHTGSLFPDPPTPFAVPESTKLRGGYYTPESLADWLCRWAIRSSTDRVLEPSCGDGIFLAAACQRLISLGATTEAALGKVQGVEIAREEANKGKDRLKKLLGVNPNGQIACADFFAWNQRERRRYDCVIGNPPFIRYQHFPEP